MNTLRFHILRNRWKGKDIWGGYRNNNAIHFHNISELLFIIIYWIIAVRLVVALEFFILNPTDFFKSGSKFYKIMLNNLFASVVAGLLIGLITGLAELYLFQRFFKRLSFLVLFLAKLLLYLASIMIIGVLTLSLLYVPIRH